MNVDRLGEMQALLTDFVPVLGELRDFLRRTCGPTVNCEGSEADEDRILEKLLPGTGTYVDVGAWHPIECSNTWRLYQRGWRGLMIEPLTYCHHALLRYRPGDYVSPYAASNKNGIRRMFVCESMSALEADRKMTVQAERLVETKTLKDILAAFPEIRKTCRFLSVDVEGHERQVFQGIDWATFRPEVICAEWKDYDPVNPVPRDLSDAWRHILEEQNYKEVAQTGCNLIFQQQPKPAPAPASQPAAKPPEKK